MAGDSDSEPEPSAFEKIKHWFEGAKDFDVSKKTGSPKSSSI